MLLAGLLREPVLAWLYGHTHYSNSQLYDSARSKWLSAAGGSCHDGPAVQGESVLLASNQLG